jgi:hypothetical protein
MPDSRVRLRRTLVLLALLSAAWAATLIVTRGVVWQLGPLRISSRNARNPVFATVLLVAISAIVAPRGSRIQALRDDLDVILDPLRRLIARVSPALARTVDTATGTASMTSLAVLMAVAIVVLSWTRGAWVAGGADSFGYVSEAHLLATGQMQLRTPFLPTRTEALPPNMVAPLGYKASLDGQGLVPTYSPGLPLAMALVEKVAGRSAVYVVLPGLAALAIWFTYLLGRRAHGPAAGFGAALLVFASPAFRFQVVGAPMSDIPAAAWWTMALTLVLYESTASAALAGAAAGMAVLTRPNLLLLAVVLGGYLLWKVWGERALFGTAGRRLVLFSIGVIAGSVLVAWFNARWYGSPFQSGYDTSALFGLSFWHVNLRQFPWWLTITQTPLLLGGLAAPFVVTRRRPAAALLVTFACAEFACYLFYMPFDAWWYLRFLLPAYPALAVATCIALDGAAVRIGDARRAIPAALVAGAAAFGLYYSSGFEMLGEYRYRVIADYVREHLPERAVIVAMQHSGSTMLYAGRPIIRYDVTDRDHLAAAIDAARDAGYHPYVVADDWEVRNSATAFEVPNRRGPLDWPPVAKMESPANTGVWDLLEDPAAARQRPVETIPFRP